jgi:ABC-type transporter Mla subunit MlaD
MTETTADWTPEQRAAFMARRASRNRALGLLLGALVVLFFGITVVRMQGKPSQIPAQFRAGGAVSQEPH